MLSSKNHSQNIKSWLIRNVHCFIETNNMDEVEPESSRKSITNKIHNIANSYIIKLRIYITSMKKQKLSKHMSDTLKYSKIVKDQKLFCFIIYWKAHFAARCTNFTNLYKEFFLLFISCLSTNSMIKSRTYIRTTD